MSNIVELTVNDEQYKVTSINDKAVCVNIVGEVVNHTIPYGGHAWCRMSADSGRMELGLSIGDGWKDQTSLTRLDKPGVKVSRSAIDRVGEFLLDVARQAVDENPGLLPEGGQYAARKAVESVSDEIAELEEKLRGAELRLEDAQSKLDD